MTTDDAIASNETREDGIISLCILAGKTVAETSTWLASGKTYQEIFRIFLTEADRCASEPWWPESEVERQSNMAARWQNPS